MIYTSLLILFVIAFRITSSHHASFSALSPFDNGRQKNLLMSAPFRFFKRSRFPFIRQDQFVCFSVHHRSSFGEIIAFCTFHKILAVQCKLQTCKKKKSRSSWSSPFSVTNAKRVMSDLGLGISSNIWNQVLDEARFRNTSWMMRT